MPNLGKIFLRNPYSPLFWILLGFIFKAIPFLAVILNHPYRDIPGIWGATMGDDSSYLAPIDNWLLHGAYSPDYRMPGYGVFYLLFRLIFGQAGACNGLIILQLVLAAISVYCLALTAQNLTKKVSAFYITFYLFLICTFSNFYDAYIGSESMCASMLIISVYFFSEYALKQQTKYLLLAGVLATWVLFIRPAFGGLFPVYCFIILFQKNKEIGIKIKRLILFILPFFIVESAWIYRNFGVHKKFAPFTSSGPFYPDQANTYLQPFFEFVQSWGGACTFSNKHVDLDWFQYHYPGKPFITEYDSLPDNIYTSTYNKDSLLRLKKMILALQKPSLGTTMATQYQLELRTKFYQYKLSFKRDKPFTYFVKAPFKMMGVMLCGPVARAYLDRGQSVPLIGKAITSFNYLIYFTILILGLIGSLFLIFQGFRQNYALLIIPFIPLFTLLIHPYVFRFFDTRFLLPAFPFLIICAALSLQKIQEKYSSNN